MLLLFTLDSTIMSLVRQTREMKDIHMSDTYNKHSHTFVMIEVNRQHPMKENVILHDNELFQIVHVTSDRVWISATYADEIVNAVQINDTFSNGFDEDGNCLLSVPMSQCKFYTDDEAETIHQCMEIDQAMLRNAY